MTDYEQTELRVFLSWSGGRSSAAAKAFRDWLPRAMQNVRPFYNYSDTDKGSRWGNEIRGELERTDFGIIFLTPENLTSPWILFEAGALSKLEKSKVAPFLLDLKPTDVTGPLAQFQATEFSHDDCFQLFTSLNRSMGVRSIDPGVLADVFNQWWPKLEEQIQNALKVQSPRTGTILRSDRELIEETLEAVRRLEMESPATELGHDVIVYETAQTMWHSIEAVLERIVMDLQHSDDECSVRCLSLIREIEAAALNFTAHPHHERGS